MPLPRIIPVLVLLAVIFSLSAGCTGSREAPAPLPQETAESAPRDIPQPVEPSGTPGVPAIPSHLTPLPVQTSCPDPAGESPWISLDPIPDPRQGDVLIISGETNLPVGKTIEILITEASYHTMLRCGSDDELRAAARVRNGGGCNHSFSVPLDSTLLGPQEYFVTARFRQDTAISTARLLTVMRNATRFPGGPAGTDPSPTGFLALDPVWDVRQGDPIVVTGATGAADYAIRYSLRNALYGAECEKSCTGELYGGSMYPVTGAGDPGTFSLQFSSADADPGRYVLRMEKVCTDEAAEKSFTILSREEVL